MRVVTIIRKPLVEENTSRNCVEHGTGGLNIGACRIPYLSPDDMTETVGKGTFVPEKGVGNNLAYCKDGWGQWTVNREGRWPANLLLSTEAADKIDDQSGYLKTGKVASHSEKGMWSSGADIDYADVEQGGGASRFFRKVSS